MRLPQGADFLHPKGAKRSRTKAPSGAVFLSALTVYMEKDYFDDAMSYGGLRDALRLACRGVRWKDSVVGYELHAAQNTQKLLQEIRGGTYRISPYQLFTIYEPKKREIVATRIRDRQVQMALCRGGLYEDITEHFIHDNCACQNGKGTDFALKRVKTHLRRYYQKHGPDGWVLKCDIKKFFPNTPHDTAKQAIEKRVSDPKARQMVFSVIDSFDGDRGIGLGSQISQLVELAVLDDLDHFIKERLRVKYYERSVDDFILIHESKDFLKSCWAAIDGLLHEIGLELNAKTRLYPLRQGVKFLQWRFILTDSGKIVMKMNAAKVGKERQRIRKLAAKEAAGLIPEGTTWNSVQSWMGNAMRGDSYFRVRRMREYYMKTMGRYADGNGTGTAFESGA